MALKEIVDRDCGGANPLMKLASHFTEDKALTQHGILQPQFSGPGLPLSAAQPDELVNEFLGPGRYDLMPTSFQMDRLLQEVEEIETMYSMPLTEPIDQRRDSWVSEHNKEPVDSQHWAREFLNDIPYDDNQVEQRPVHHPDWTQEFLSEVPLPPGQTNAAATTSNIWADEFLDHLEKRTETEESQGTPASELAATVDDLLLTVDSNDPKFKNSKFIQFLHGIRDGSIKLEKPSAASDLVTGAGDKWVNEFVTGQQRIGAALDDEEAWVQEYVQSDFVNQSSFDNFFQEINVQNNLANEWVDEYQTENEKQHFWENLQKQWEDLAKQGNPEVQSWVTSYENFDASTYYKDYSFEDTNPLLDHEDAFNEGLERLKKGEISNAVLLFEAAVRKQPEHMEAWQYLGTTQAANEQDPAAIAALKKCLELNAGNLTALMALAVSYTNESLQQNACAALSDWIQHNPKYSHLLTASEPSLNSSTASSSRISSFMSMEYHREVEDLYLKAVRSSPQEIDADVQVGLGILLNLSNEYDKAVDCFKAALQLRPDDALIWNKLGATLSNSGRSAEAVEAFRRALDIVPGYVRTRHNLGLACMNLGADREAMEHFLTALSLQKSGRGVKGTSAVMSDNIWSSVRTAISKMDRGDLYDLCDKKDLDAFKSEFHVDV